MFKRLLCILTVYIYDIIYLYLRGEIYEQKSSYLQQSITNEQTVDNQLKVLREVAEKRGLEVVREISDEGISGATGRDARKGFDELIKGSIKNEWDIILVWDVSRLGRSLKHLVSFLEDNN
jgi:DNA invertase Pin-like site-specific DNA recombinase